MQKIESLYLHVPFCKHLCNYCDFYKKRWESESSQLRDFHQLLDHSWVRHKEFLFQNKMQITDLKTLYFGGGTPSLWGQEGANYFKNKMTDWEITFQPEYEWTMEVDPNAWSEESILQWMELGVNRFSVGAQSLDEQFLKTLDRNHNLLEVENLLKFLHKNKSNFSVDFMIGAPVLGKNSRNIVEELSHLMKFEPKHLSLYILQTRTHYQHFKFLPDDEVVQKEYVELVNYLKSKNFNHYEVSNFAQPGFESSHNKAYWKMKNVAGIGPSATGFIQTSPTSAIRYKWKVTEANFTQEILGVSELCLEKIYLTWRSAEWWRLSDFDFKKSHVQTVELLLKEWVNLGYFEESQGMIRTKSEGFIILDTLIGKILRYLN